MSCVTWRKVYKPAYARCTHLYCSVNPYIHTYIHTHIYTHTRRYIYTANTQGYRPLLLSVYIHVYINTKRQTYTHRYICIYIHNTHTRFTALCRSLYTYMYEVYNSLLLCLGWPYTRSTTLCCSPLDDPIPSPPTNKLYRYIDIFMYICTANKKWVLALCCSLYSCLRVYRVRIFASAQIIQPSPFSPLPHILSLTFPRTYLLFITRLATEHSRLYALQPFPAPGQICKQHRKVLCVNPFTKHQQNKPQHIEATLQCHLHERKNMELKNMGRVW